MTKSAMIEPGSSEWLRLITPSKVAAILGVSRWESPYRLWHRMKGLVPPEPPADRFAVGHAMELGLAELWRIENPGWQLSRQPVQLHREFADFESIATLDRRARRGRWRKVVEFKTCRKWDEWGDFGTDAAPTDYLVQVLWQMHVTGFTQEPAELLVMGPYFDHRTYPIPYDLELCLEIERRCTAWQRSLQSDTPPPLDDSVATYECVRALHQTIDDTVTAELDRTLAVEFLDAYHLHKTAETRLRGAKTRVLDAMGSAADADACGQHIATRRPAKGGSVALYADTKTHADQLKELTPA